jgi:hypothetical protein
MEVGKVARLMSGRRVLLALAVALTVSAPATSVRAAEPTTPTLSHNTYIKASNTAAVDQFGSSVAIDGDTMVVGAPSENTGATGVNGPPSDVSATNSGAVYIFVRSGASWIQQAYIKASNRESYDEFGRSVGIDGDTVVVGAPYEDSSATGVDGSQSSNSASDSGAAYVFSRTGGTWAQQAYLKASNTGADDHFGETVAVSGGTVVVGASSEDSAATTVNGDAGSNTAGGAGAAYVFTRSGTNWAQQACLKASNAETGDAFGWSVTVSGETVVVGAVGEDSASTGVNGGSSDNSADTSGAAFVFTRSGTAWAQQSYLKAINTENSDNFGLAVALDDDTLVVGAPGEDGAARGVNGNPASNALDSAGAAYVYTRSAGIWSYQAYLKASNPGKFDGFGSSVAVTGETVVVGAPSESSDATGVDGYGADDSAASSGAAYRFTRAAGVWAPSAYIKATNTDELDVFGLAVGATSDRIVIGAAFEASNSVGLNGDQENDLATEAGAVYVLGPSCVSAPFPDVPTSHQFCAEIEWMSQTGVSTGFGDGTYRPATAVSRQAMSAFLARFAHPNYGECGEFGPFNDVPPSNPFCAEIQWMQAAGISAGFEDGTYRPFAAVTRQAMSAFLARLAGATLPACTSAPFSDVPTGHPFCEEIRWMKDTGISTGFGDGTYRPGANVTRQAMSAFLYRLRLLTD